MARRTTTLHTPGPVESGIPIPPRRHVRQTKYPFHTMAVGDSFVVDGKASGLSPQCSYASRATGYRFTMRTIGPGRVRIWRIA